MAIQAKYNGRCQCGEAISAGDTVDMSKANGSWKVTACKACKPELVRNAPAAEISVRVRVTRVRTNETKFSSVSAVLEAFMDGTDPHAWPIGKIGFSVIGSNFPMPIAINDLLEVRGRLSNDPQWGWQIRASVVSRAVAATDEALCAYLARMPNVGAKRAETILQHFGGREAVLKMFESAPERLSEVSGITPVRAQEIADQYRTEVVMRDTLIFLAGLKISERVQAQIIEDLGEDAKLRIEEDPYILQVYDGVGFQTADEIGQRLKIGQKDPRRLAALAQLLLDTAAREGHTISKLEHLLELS